jgi:NAD(P)-dependent dehydrogenase (short-subunit alcohol dehydrogenase family)
LAWRFTRNVIARGDNVIATERSASRLDDLLSDSSIDLRVLALDVTAPIADIKRQVDFAIHVWGRIDVLVNNAGIATFGAIEEVGFVRSIHQLYRSSQRSNTVGLQGPGDDGCDVSQIFRCRECNEYCPPSHASPP